MKECCNGDCNQGRNCPMREESKMNVKEFLNLNYGYALALLYFVTVCVFLFQ